MLINPSPGNRFVSFRSCVRCEAVCERETDEISVARVADRFTTPARVACVARPLAAFWFKKCTTLARNRHFWLKTVKNVRASRVFIFSNRQKRKGFSRFHFVDLRHSRTESSSIFVDLHHSRTESSSRGQKIAKACENTVKAVFFAQNIELSLKNRFLVENR